SVSTLCPVHGDSASSVGSALKSHEACWPADAVADRNCGAAPISAAPPYFSIARRSNRSPFLVSILSPPPTRGIATEKEKGTPRGGPLCAVGLAVYRPLGPGSRTFSRRGHPPTE